MAPASPTKIVRFSEIVKRCGSPEPHLVLIDPSRDKALQTAVKANRVMTLFQASRGGKVDYGTVGFEQGPSRQYLIFPKSLRAFTGRRVVGIKYDLLSFQEIPKKLRAGSAKPPKPRKPPARSETKTPKAIPVPKSPKAQKPKPERKASKIVPFRSDDDEESNAPNRMPQARKLAQQAMDALEAGKQVAAFNLLKRILTL